MLYSRHDDVVHRFAAACRLGNIGALAAALDADAVAVCDGGGLVPAPPGSVHGPPDIAQLVAVLLGGRPGTELTVEAVNGRSGLAVRHAGRAVAVVSVGTVDTLVTDLWIVLNPAKLRGWHRP